MAVYAHQTPSINPVNSKAVHPKIPDNNGQKRVKGPYEARVSVGLANPSPPGPAAPVRIMPNDNVHHSKR